MTSTNQQIKVFPQHNVSSVRKKNKTPDFSQIEAPESATATKLPTQKNRCKQR